MAWTFRKRIKIIPGIHLNFSKSGISTSIGVRGASLNFSSRGASLNTSIPGTGISYRQKLGVSNQVEKPLSIEPEAFHSESSTSYDNNIFSASVDEITSQDMAGIKQAIMMAHSQREDLKKDLISVEKDLKSFQTKRLLSIIFLYGFVMKNYRAELQESIHNQKQAIEAIHDKISQAYVELNIDFEDELLQNYENVLESFEKLAKSNRIWDVTAEHAVDRYATRSAASTSVFRKTVHFKSGHLPEIKSAIPAMIWQNRNGGDIYFYPNFIIIWNNRESFAVVGIDEIDIILESVRFIESEKVPGDSKVIDQTWYKVNKNGSPDRRFRDNYQIPICQYGNIDMKSKTGLNESYMFSNYELTDSFTKSYLEFQISIIHLEYLPSFVD
ncbi:MAG: DUF4236 domain-containing protein [Bacteroidota bacterium]